MILSQASETSSISKWRTYSLLTKKSNTSMSNGSDEVSVHFFLFFSNVPLGYHVISVPFFVRKHVVQCTIADCSQCKLALGMDQLYEWTIDWGYSSMLTHLLECDRSMLCERCRSATAIQQEKNVLTPFVYFHLDYFELTMDELEKVERILLGHYPIIMGFVD